MLATLVWSAGRTAPARYSCWAVVRLLLVREDVSKVTRTGCRLSARLAPAALGVSGYLQKYNMWLIMLLGGSAVRANACTCEVSVPFNKWGAGG